MPLSDDMRAAGFNASEISDALAAERSQMSAAGFDNGEINAYLGVGAFQSGPVRDLTTSGQAVAAGHAALAATAKPAAPASAANAADAGGLASFIDAAAAKIGLDATAASHLGEVAATYAADISGALGGAEDAFGYGFQRSVSGLLARGKLPEDPGHNLSTLQRTMFQFGALAGDLPAMLLGGAIGSAGVAADVVTVPAAAMALPAGMRKVLMQAYAKGGVTSWRDFFERSLAVTWATVKGGITGATVGRTGQVVPGLAKLPAEVAAMVGVGAALEGRVPDPQEFLDAAVVIGGLKAVGVAAPKLREIYAKTGRRPAAVASDAADPADPAQGAEISAHVAAGRPGLPPAYQAEAARQQAARSATLATAIEGLRGAMADPVKFDELQKARPEIHDLGQVQAMLENLQAEKAGLAESGPPATVKVVPGHGGDGNVEKPPLRTERPIPVTGAGGQPSFPVASEAKTGRTPKVGSEPKGSGSVTPSPGKVDIAGGQAAAAKIATGEARYVKAGGREFVALDNGKISLGLIDPGLAAKTGTAPGAVRLARGGHNAKTGRGVGELHIEAQRGEAIRQAGYADAAELVADVAGGFNQIWTAKKGRLLLVKANGKAKLAVVELERSASGAAGGDFYNVISAGIYRKGYAKGGGRKLLWEGERRSHLAGDASPLRRGGQSAGSVTPSPGKVDIAGGQAVRAKVGLDPGLTEPRLELGVNKAVTAAARELLISGEVVRDPSRLISDQIAELLQTDRIDPGQYSEILARHGVTPDEFARLWRADVTAAAQTMQQLSAVEASVRKMLGNASEEDLKILRRQGLDRSAEAKGLWRRLDNLRRGILVTQLATAVRNFEVQVGRVGIDVLQRALDAAIQRALPAARRTVHPADAFAVVLRAFSPKNTKGLADQILSRFPKEADDLFLRYSSDLTKAGKGTDAMAKAEKAVWVLNAMNRFQEFAVRRPVFIAELDRRLALKGQNLEKIIAENKIGEISREDLQGAIGQALEITFAKDFSPAASGAEGIAGSFIRFINKLPGLATIPFPFPRFLMNAIKFQYEFSPLGFLKLMSKAERTKIAGGDTGAVSRAAIGTAMLFAAWQIRNSKWAGEKWWEIRLPSGETVSLLPFNPFVFNLFVADTIKRWKDGTLSTLTTKDLAFGFLSSNFRAGAGLFVLDKLIEGLAGIGNEDKALRALQGMAGSVASGFMVPLQQISDLYTQFDTWLGSGSEAVIRDNRDRPFGDQIIARIPGLDQTLPAAASPTRAAPMRRRLPLLRQLTGIGIREAKNPAERELDRLGFSRQEIAPSVGDPVADRLIAKHLGPLVEATITPLVQTPFYLNQSNEVQGGLLREVLLGLRKMAIDAARAEDPARFRKIRVLGMPRRRRRMIESLTGINLGDLFTGVAPAKNK